MASCGHANARGILGQWWRWANALPLRPHRIRRYMLAIDHHAGCWVRVKPHRWNHYDLFQHNKWTYTEVYYFTIKINYTKFFATTLQNSIQHIYTDTHTHFFSCEDIQHFIKIKSLLTYIKKNPFVKKNYESSETLTAPS